MSGRLNRMPGWQHPTRPHIHSWAYHGDDGGYFGHTKPSYAGFGERYGPGDVVGCGVDFDREIVFFTRNGKKTSMEFYWIRSTMKLTRITPDFEFTEVKGRLFPAVGFRKDEVRIEANFGTDLKTRPFKWDETASAVA